MRLIRFTLPLLVLLLASPLFADPVPVRFMQGTVHGFLVIKDLSNRRLATGDLVQTVHGDRVSAETVFHFQDGSLDDETTVFVQDKVLRLISDHHIQRGPSFPKPMDLLIDAVTGQITSRGKDGVVHQDHLDLPPDVANGLPSNILSNLEPNAAEIKVAYVAVILGKPHLIHLSIKPAGDVSFSMGGVKRKATDYVIHIELGGVAGVVAPIIGKQPKDQHLWVMTGPAPVFIRQQGQLYEDGPIWRIEQTCATFSQ